MRPPLPPLRGLAALSLALAALAGPLSAQWDEDWDEEEAAPPWLHGRFAARYLHREGRGREQDRDLYGHLRLRGGSASRDDLSMGLSMRGAWDADGPPAGGPGGSFGSLQDGRSSRFAPRLDEAWLGFHRLLGEGELKLGRQSRWDTPVLLHFDGGAASAPFSAGEAPGRLEVYGGVPEHRWEGARRGDSVVGAAASVAAWRGGSLRLDALHLRDRNHFGDRRNTLYAARAAHAAADGRIGGALSASLLDGDADLASVDAWWASEDDSLRLNLMAEAQLGRRADETLELASYATLLRQIQPYQEATLMASWTPAPALRLDLGASGRGLRGGAAASEFNREYERYWTAVEFPELLGSQTSLSLGADLWDSGRDRVVAGNAELAAVASGWEAALASGFSLYRFDFYSARERTRVREHSLSLRRELGEAWRLSLRLSLEHDETESYRTGVLGLELSF